MPFGLMNAPSIFRGLMNQIFKPYLRRFVLVFFDDILVYSKSLEEHSNHLSQVLKLLRHHQLFAKLSKCKFECLFVDYLEHVILENGIVVDPKKLQAIEEWPLPRAPKALREFLKLIRYYRKFIQGYGGIAAPLNALLKKEAFVWTKGSCRAFEKLKHAMMSPPVLKMSYFNKEFILECDSSHGGMGTVLMQDGHPIVYSSQGLEGKALLLSTYEKEMLSILLAMNKWQQYLLGRRFIIKTDQRSLKFLLD